VALRALRYNSAEYTQMWIRQSIAISKMRTFWHENN